jgi:integrase
MTVRQALQRVKGKYLLLPPKSKTSRRVIVGLPVSIVNALREHKARQEKERQALGDRWLNQHGLVFTTAYGAPLNGTWVTHCFQGLCKEAGLRHLRFHDLRHSCASILQKMGVPIADVQKLLGHSHPSLTQATYTHALSQETTMAAVDRVLRGRANGTAKSSQQEVMSGS